MATLGLSFWFWTLQKTIITEGVNNGLIIQSIVVFAIITVLVSLNLMISGKAIGILMAMTLPGMFLVKFGFNNQILLMTAGVSFILGIYAHFAASREKSQRVKLGIACAKGGVGIYFLAGLLLLTAISYQTNFLKGELKLSESNVGLLMPLIESQIKSQVPFYSADMPIEDILVVSALSSGEITLSQKNFSKELQKKIQEKIAQDGSQSMDVLMQYPEIQQLIIRDAVKNNPQLIAKLRSDYGEKFGISIKQGQSMTAIIIDIANSFIEKLTAPFKSYLPIALAVIFFFSFKVIGFLFVDMALLVGGAVFLILKAGGVLEVKSVSVMQETLE